MSFTYGFYNSKNGDRKYYAEQMAMLVDGLITNGVFMTVGDRFMVKPSSGMSVSVGTGHAWYDATWSHNDSELIMTAEQSDLLLDRIDALVLEVDKTESIRANAIKWVTGIPATNPVKPALTFGEYLRQRPIAYIRIPANSTEIKAENIESCVGTSACPFVTGVLEGMDIDNLVAQWEAQFISWFEKMKDQLDEDAAGNLQNQIDALEANLDGKIDALETNFENAVSTTLKSYDINAINIDSTPGNWTVDISESGHGTVPKAWVNVTQTTSGHFFVQTAIRCDTRNTNAYENGEIWIRDKYDGAAWSKWSKLAREQDVMPISGGTFTGMVTLSGAPTANLHAATKQYVDAVKTTANNAMPKSAYTLSGTTLTINW